MATMNPIQFIQQVRAEVAKVVWPTRREVLLTTVMVFIMAALTAVFFALVDLGIRGELRVVLSELVGHWTHDRNGLHTVVVESDHVGVAVGERTHDARIADFGDGFIIEPFLIRLPAVERGLISMILTGPRTHQSPFAYRPA